MDILTNSSKQLFETDKFQLNLLQSETLVIVPQDKSTKKTNTIISTPIDSRKISRNCISRIDTPGVNKDVWSVIDTTSNVLSDADNVEKFDTSVQSSNTQERNLKLSRIKEESLKSIFPEFGTKLDSSIWVNFANSVVREIPKLKCLGHSPMETAYIRNLDYISTTRPKKCNRLKKKV